MFVKIIPIPPQEVDGNKWVKWSSANNKEKWCSLKLSQNFHYGNISENIVILPWFPDWWFGCCSRQVAWLQGHKFLNIDFNGYKHSICTNILNKWMSSQNKRKYDNSSCMWNLKIHKLVWLEILNRHILVAIV